MVYLILLLICMLSELVLAKSEEEIQVIAQPYIGLSSSSDFDAKEASLIPGGKGDILSIITIIPSIASPQYRTPGGNEQGYYIRGSNLNDNQYLVDWLPLGYIFHFGAPGFDYSVVHSSLINNFTIHLGGFSPRYGSVAGGVIEVDLKPPRLDKLYQEYRIGSEVGFVVEGPLSNDEGFWFSLRRSYFDLVFNLFFKNNSPGSKKKEDRFTIKQFPRFYDLHSKYRKTLSDGYVDFTVISSTDIASAAINEANDPSIIGGLSVDRGFTVGGVRWVYEEQEYRSSLNVNWLHNVSGFSIGTQGEGDPNPGGSFTLDNVSNSFQLQSHHEFTFSNHHFFTVGIDLERRYGTLGGYFSLPNSNDAGSSALTFSKRTKAILEEKSVRSNFEPHVTYIYQDEIVLVSIGARLLMSDLSNNVTSTKYHYRAVSDRSRLEFYIPQGSVYINYGTYPQLPEEYYLSSRIGAPELVMPQQATHTILGIKSSDIDGWQYKFEYWKKETKQLTIRINELEKERIASTGVSFTQGFDFEIRKQFSSDSNLYLSMSRSKGTRSNYPGGPTYPFGGDQPLSFNIAFSSSADDQGWSWGMRALLHEGQPYTKVVARQSDIQINENGDLVQYFKPIYGPYKGARLPLFFQLDMNFRYQEPGTDWYYTVEFVGLSEYLRQNVISYRYGTNYEKIARPSPRYTQNFLPSFLIETRF
ncbi:MAG: TonB-dependent receptor [Methylacidiphilales bacterium]|nr:TonB-dependent receptor [Candidatus Methylacidiphilales bacterium]